MKKFFVMGMLMLSLCAAVSAQSNAAAVNAAMKKFPGVPKANMEEMIAAKRVMQIALPTWVPAGFKIEDIKSRIGRGVAIEDREFVIIYSRSLQNGKIQRFAFEAGFDGLGGLPYDVTKVIPSAVGKIDLMYEPKDLDDESKNLKFYVYTEWYQVGKTAFHYIGYYGSANEEGEDPTMAMISLADTEKILKSLQRL